MPASGLGFDRRRAGVGLHLTSLPGRAGVGELGPGAIRFLDWMQAAGLSIWQFLPLGPTGYGHSPYQPVSVFAGNPLLIGLDGLVELGLLDPAEAAIEAAGDDGTADYDRAARIKGPLLALAADRFGRRADTALAEAFAAFCADNGEIWLDAYTAFVLQRERNGGRAWPQWPAAERRCRRGSAAALARSEPVAAHRIRLVQFLFAWQWEALRVEARRRGIALFGDVPIYLALDCAEAWAHPELLLLDESFVPIEVAGVPPDYFSADGQLWGNPVYAWDAHAADGFRWWIERLRHALERADVVRLDHFRAFDEYWSVPQGATTASEGRWHPGPGARLFDALAAELGGVPFVAEDLGLITDSVIALRRAYNLPGMQVLQFLVDQPDFDLDAIEPDCVCYTGTHDNDTTRGWFAGSNGRLAGQALADFRSVVRQNVEGTAEDIHKSMISLCFSSQACMAIAPMQDYLGLGSESRFNTPGTAAGNWLWRLGERELDAVGPAWIEAAVREHRR